MALSEFLSVVVLLLVSSAVGHSRTLPSTRPLVIAHRGASGVLPEHSVESFKRALSDGADILHCDATLSGDLVPLCLHEYELSVTTDVADRPEFRDRIRNITVNHNGELVTLVDWFAFDFTLDELKTLRTRQQLDFRDQSFNGQFAITTVAEYIEVAQSATRPVAIYIEHKNPALINSLFLRGGPLRFEDILLEVLESYGYGANDGSCYLMCLEEESLLYLKTRTRLPLLIVMEDMVSDDRLADWSRSFYGVGVWVNVVAPHHTAENGPKNWIFEVTDIVPRVHAHGLKAHLWTLRNEDRYLPWDFEQDVYNAFDFYLSHEVDAIFTDFPKSLVKYLNMVYNRN